MPIDNEQNVSPGDPQFARFYLHISGERRFS